MKFLVPKKYCLNIISDSVKFQKELLKDKLFIVLSGYQKAYHTLILILAPTTLAPKKSSSMNKDKCTLLLKGNGLTFMKL